MRARPSRYDLARISAGGGALGSGLSNIGVYGTAALTAMPWYARNLKETGNPVFPLWNQAFGGRQWSAEDEAEILRAWGVRF